MGGESYRHFRVTLLVQVVGEKVKRTPVGVASPKAPNHMKQSFNLFLHVPLALITNMPMTFREVYVEHATHTQIRYVQDNLEMPNRICKRGIRPFFQMTSSTSGIPYSSNTCWQCAYGRARLNIATTVYRYTPIKSIAFAFHRVSMAVSENYAQILDAFNAKWDTSHDRTESVITPLESYVPFPWRTLYFIFMVG